MISRRKAVVFASTSAFISFVASVFVWNPRPCALLATRREKEIILVVFVGTENRRRSDDDHNCPI